MTRNTPTVVAWCLPALLAASIITCLPGIDNHLHRKLLSPPADICRPYQFPMETYCVWRPVARTLLSWVPPLPKSTCPKGVLRKSIRGMMPSKCCLKSGGLNRQGSAPEFDRCQTSTFWIERWLITGVDPPVRVITTYIKDTWKSPNDSASYGEVQKISPARQRLRNITINEVQHSNWQHIHRLF